MKAPLVITHGSCRDGFCAAWVVRRKFPDAEIHFAYYGKEPPDVTDRDVIMVDFSYPREVMSWLAVECRSLVVLDHHKTAEAALAGWGQDMDPFNVNTPRGGRGPYVLFDMNRSGAGLAWDYFFAGELRPWLVDYVEDRDLWRHKLPHSHAVNAYIGVLQFDFDVWDRVDRSTPVTAAAHLGDMVVQKVTQYVAEASKNLRWCGLPVGDGHYRVPVVNAPQVDISELLDAVIREHDPPFAVGWWQRFDGLFQYSLRSRGDFDVSAIAKTFGGGGHKNAAGFQSATMVHV